MNRIDAVTFLIFFMSFDIEIDKTFFFTVNECNTDTIMYKNLTIV